jgi:hypothetical protein
MFEELKKNIKEISLKLKSIDKKVAIDEYLSLVKQKAELERKLTNKKIRFIELEKNKKDRSRREHAKFLIGGIIAKYYPEILELSDDEKIKNTIEKILKNEQSEKNYYELNAEKFETVVRDGEEYLKLKKGI